MIRKNRRRVSIALAGAALVWLVSVACVVTGAEYPAALPQPIDVPLGPPSVMDPASAALPSLSDAVAVNSPAISMASDPTLPGETLAITGAGLEGARLYVWSEAGMRTVEPLRTAADRMQAVVPQKCAASTMLVWPVRGDRVGTPIRVNGAVTWWAWPVRAAAHRGGQTVRLFGKNLQLEGHAPQVYLRGPGTAQWLKVVESNSNHVEAALPDDLAAGTYEVWCHNGTGGRWGWSQSIEMNVVDAPSTESLPVFHVEDYGAVVDDDQDDWQGLTAAIRAAQEAGGGNVQLAPGNYLVSKPLEIGGEGPAGIHLIGAGMGQHRWHNEPAPHDHRVVHVIVGRATVLRPLPGHPFPAELLRIARRYSRVADVTLQNHADRGKQRCLSVVAHDVHIERLRGIVVDERPQLQGWDQPEATVTIDEYKSRLQDEAVLRIDAPGEANIVIEDCEFHHPGAGIDTPPIRRAIGHNPSRGICPEGTHYIRISGCKFRGYFDGRLEPQPPDPRFAAFRGWHNAGWQNSGSRNAIVERCDFAGADKRHFKVLTRSLYQGNTSIRELYLAHNTGHDLAPTSMSPGYHENKGEQILFHLWYPQGGLFDLTTADADSLTVSPELSKYAGTEDRHPGVEFNGPAFSYVPRDVDANPEHWVVFVCAGRGVGQYRVVRGIERNDSQVTLRLAEPWRVVPDRSSRIVLNAAYRRIIIYGNELDGGYVDPVIKSHGVVFWANSFENVVRRNVFRNLTGGVVINTFYRCPTGWNETCYNRLENIYGNGGDTVFPGQGAFYVDHIRVGVPAPEDRVWYSAGNVARGNTGSGADVAAYLHRPDYGHIDHSNPALPAATREMLLQPRGDNTVVNYTYPATPEGGLMLSVVENNRFVKVHRGIVISSPVQWLLLRHNQIELSSAKLPPFVDESREAGYSGARDVLVINDKDGE